MKIRRFRAYAEREDLREMLQEFQNMFDIYYVPAYSDEGPACFQDAAALTDLGIKRYPAKTDLRGFRNGADGK